MRGGLSASNIQIAPWMGMALLLAVYVWDVASLHPANLFGAYHDDSVYFASAKALAQGRGYIMPNFPGAPPQTKYPVLYPWMLSWIWRIHPAFPQNVAAGIALTVFFGCWSLVAAFQIVRRLGGIGDWTALLLTAFCALQPLFLGYSGAILSDLPFMALALTALALADFSIAPGGSLPVALLAGALAGLSVGMRTLGIAIIAGIFFAALYRRAYKEGCAFALAAGGLAAVSEWPRLVAASGHQSVVLAASLPPGWAQNLAYYRSYGAIWRVCVPNFTAFLRVLEFTAPFLLLAPGRYFVTPLGESGSRASLSLSLILTVAIVSGMIRQARSHGLKPIHFALPFYSAILVVWPYPMMGRFLLPFLPLFMAGIWIELQRFTLVLRRSMRATTPPGEKCVAAALALFLMVMAAIGGWRELVQDHARLEQDSSVRRAALEEQLQAYQWIREHTMPEDRIIAYEDPLLYLYTGRQAVRAAVISPALQYMGDDQAARSLLVHFTDTAQMIRARYWLTCADDFSLDSASDLIAARMAEIKSVLPRVFQSSGRTVEIYDSSCVAEPQEAQCRSAARILFPASQ